MAQAVDKGRTVWDGVYSRDQAERGRVAYTASCSGCHLDDLTAYRGALHGAAFIENFQSDSLDNLFRVTKRTMPRDAPASLHDETYLDIIAYVLQVNSYPFGSTDLKLEALKNIQIVPKSGAEAVPNFALVEVVGCLASQPNDHWGLINASEAARKRNPDAVAAADLTLYAARPLGKRTYQLLDTSYFHPVAHVGQKMVAKGFLVKRAAGDQINITSLQMVAEKCSP